MTTINPTDSSASDLYEHIGYWHNRFGRQVETSFERRLAAYDVTVSQWGLMRILFHQQAETVREVARILQLDVGAITRLADRLEAKGLIVRLPHATDARSVNLALTPAGEALIPALAREADYNDAHFFAVLNDIEIAQYKQLLTKLLVAAGQEIPAEWQTRPLRRANTDSANQPHLTENSFNPKE